MRTVTFENGVVLHVAPAPFEDAKALFQALMFEARSIPISGQREMGDMMKDLFTIGFSSPLIEEKLKACMSRCMYNGSKIDKDTFEPLEAREHYLAVCAEVAQENISPFLKSLFAKFKEALKMTETIQKL